MKVRAALMFLLLCCVGQAVAQMGGGGGGGGGRGAGQRPVMPNIDRETMIVTRPDDWSAPQATADENKTDIYRFPDGEEYSDWTEMLRQEVYNTTAGMETAERVYELRSAGDQENCPNYTSEVREQEPENGYSIIVWRQSCTPAEDVIFSSLHKVVLGNDRLYILSKVWKDDPSNRIWRRWENYFEDVYVCDPNRSEHPCRPIPRDPGNATGAGGRSAL